MLSQRPARRPARNNRKYPEAKLQENLDSEIMEVLLEEAREAFDADAIVELRSDSPDEMEANLDRMEAWLRQWRVDNGVAG